MKNRGGEGMDGWSVTSMTGQTEDEMNAGIDRQIYGWKGLRKGKKDGG